MASYTYGIGKGLREPCSPNRQAYFFGAVLNSVSADGWNCLPNIVDSTTSFDLSAIPKNREIVVAHLNISGIADLDCQVTFRWYRERDGALLYQGTYKKGAAWWQWTYAYSYIGYLDKEISENGEYSIRITVSGDISYSRTIYFTVTGIPVVAPIPPAPVPIGASIVEALNSVSARLFSLYYDIYDLPVIGQYLAIPFYWLSQLFSNIAWEFSSFFVWVNNLAAKAAKILSWDTIWSFILTYIPNLEQIRDWFYYWVTYVWQEVNKWWNATQSTVRSWISTATQGLNSLIVAWGNFWQVTFPNLVSQIDLDIWSSSWLQDVQALINSAFVGRDSLWANWQDMRDDVVQFFTDPWEWLYDRFEDFFERFW